MCEFCEKREKTLYQVCRYGNMYINWFGKKPLLTVYPTVCPPFAKCSAKEMSGEIGISYAIRFCPECGEKLTEN